MARICRLTETHRLKLFFDPLLVGSRRKVTNINGITAARFDFDCIAVEDTLVFRLGKDDIVFRCEFDGSRYGIAIIVRQKLQAVDSSTLEKSQRISDSITG